jgi:hypothetical protein
MLLEIIVVPLVREIVVGAVQETRDDVLLDLQLRPVFREMLDRQALLVVQDSVDYLAAELILKDMIEDVIRVKPFKYLMQMVYEADDLHFQPREGALLDSYLNRVLLRQLILIANPLL